MKLPMFGFFLNRKTHPAPTCDGRLKTWMRNCQVLQAAVIFLHGSGDSGPGVQARGQLHPRNLRGRDILAIPYV